MAVSPEAVARDDKEGPYYQALIVCQRQVIVSEAAAEVASKAVWVGPVVLCVGNNVSAVKG